jgi:hypothetical protein
LTFEIFLSPGRTNVHNIHGALNPLATGDTLGVGDSIVQDTGIGKIFFVVNAGATPVGTMTVSGTIVNRMTGAESEGEIDIALTGVSSDNTTTDVEGNNIYNILDAYMTSEWFKNSITVSTTDLDISDIDIYQCSFEQFNDVSGMVTLKTVDVNLQITAGAGWAYTYLYTVETSGVNNTLASINNLTSLSINAADSVADAYYRLRRGQLDKDLNTQTEGIFVNAFFSGVGAVGDIADYTLKLWATTIITVSPFNL